MQSRSTRGMSAKGISKIKVAGMSPRLSPGLQAAAAAFFAQPSVEALTPLDQRMQAGGAPSLVARASLHKTKNELIAAVADETKLTKAAAAAAVEATFDIIAKALQDGENVKLVGFGSFSVVTRAAREGRNPQTGKPVRIAEHRAAKFTPGKNLRQAISG